MKLDRPVPYNVTEAVHCVLEEFCGAAAKRLDIEIDSRSLDVEPGDQADPCKFQACNEFSRCVVNGWTGEAECLCDPGYVTPAGASGRPCQSTCTLRPDYCLNDGVCQIIPGHGATCKYECNSPDQADPCKFLACNEFSRCVVNGWTGEAECLCDPGYVTPAGASGRPCQSTCTLRPDYCLNDGVCQIIPGHGATCKCPVGKYWHYHGERCGELVAAPLNPALIAACLVGSVCLVGALLSILTFIHKKCIQTRKAVTLVPGVAPYAFENTLRENPVFQNDDGVLTQVSSSSSGSSQTQQSEQDAFASFENIHLSIEIPRQLYTTRTERLVSGMVDFHHCIPEETVRPPCNHHQRTCCLVRTLESECFDVSVL
ncbi:hypothetical protein CRUP_006336 [Coryphaenoides rupestris]|nr:hypothetical protein CRUP_006336 [Coryphaenoides rupestris]